MPVGCIGTGTPDRYLDCIPCNDTAQLSAILQDEKRSVHRTRISDQQCFGSENIIMWIQIQGRTDLNLNFLNLSLCYSKSVFNSGTVPAVLWSRSRPEPDFFAGAGAGEKEPAPACCYVI